MFDRALELRVAPGRGASTTVLSIKGALVLGNIPEFQEVWRTIQTDTLVFDLSGVTYIDSMALGSLVQAQMWCTKMNRKLALVGVPERVQELLQCTRLDSFFRSYSDVEAAEANMSL